MIGSQSRFCLLWLQTGTERDRKGGFLRGATLHPCVLRQLQVLSKLQSSRRTSKPPQKQIIHHRSDSKNNQAVENTRRVSIPSQKKTAHCKTRACHRRKHFNAPAPER